MKCLNCGNEIVPGEEICRVCGAIVDVGNNVVNYQGVQQPNLNNAMNYQNMQQPDVNNAMNYQNVQQPDVNNAMNYQNVQQPDVNSNPYNTAVNYQNIQQVDVNSGALEENGPKIMLTAISNDNGEDDELKDSYIGKNSAKLKDEGFSIWSMLFGAVYFAYRKFWLLALIWFIIFVVSNFFFSVFVAFIIIFVLNIILAINFEKFYIKNVNKQIMRIKTKNVSKTKDEISSIVIKKGGVSIVFALVSLIVIALSFYYIYINGSSPVQVEKLTLKVPNKFSVIDSYDTRKKYILDSNDVNSCALSISVQDYQDDDANAYLDSTVPRSDGATISPVDVKTINDKNWSLLSVTTSYGKSYYYATTRGGKVYSIVFDTYLENKDCDKAYDVVFNSLKLKVE